MQRDFCNVNASPTNLVEDLGREVQAGGRGRRRSWWLREDGLISVAIRRAVFACNIWRQWNVPDPLQAQEKVWDAGKPQSALAISATRNDLGLEGRLSGCIFTEPQFLANSKLAAGTNQCFPLVLA